VTCYVVQDALWQGYLSFDPGFPPTAHVDPNQATHFDSIRAANAAAKAAGVTRFAVVAVEVE
jgi:hypothetical protein